MKRRAVLTFVSIACLLAAGRPAARQYPDTVPAAAFAEIDQLMQKEMASAKVPGLSIAIAWKNTLVYSKAFGFADLEHQVPAKTTTAFRTASVAKPLTATAVMQLVQDGRIDLDAPIQTYCPAFPQKQWPVTARLILGHQSGIRHYGKPGESSSAINYPSIEASLSIFKNDPLLFEPGTNYLYSTFGFSVLGCAIEGASGQPYETYMSQHVFGPAGMARTRLDRIYEIIPDRARPYMLLRQAEFDQLPAALKLFAKPDQIYNGPLHDTSMKVPGGGLVSTAEDLTRFGIAVVEHRLVSEATQEAMWTEGHTRDGKATGYGLGWGVTPKQDGIRRLSHSGNQIGASTVLNVLPELGLSYAIMTNLEDTEMGPFSRGAANVLRKYLAGK